MNSKSKKTTLPKVQVNKRPVQMVKTQHFFDQIEKLLDGPLITYWNTRNGEITRDDAPALRALLADVPPCKTLFFCLTSTGGSGLAALRIANLLRRHCERLIVLVPEYAASAATMLALSANEVWLAPHANLSPVDTSIQHPLSPVNSANDQVGVGQDELSRIVSLWRKESKTETANPYSELWKYIHPLVIGAVDRATSMSIKLCDALMAHHQPDSKIRHRIAEALTTAYPSHGYPILLSEARDLGIPVAEMHEILENLLAGLLECYVEVASLIRTDQDQDHHHDDEKPVLTERAGRMVYCSLDRDWYYRTEEKRWLPMHSVDEWHIAELQKEKVVNNRLYIQ